MEKRNVPYIFQNTFKAFVKDAAMLIKMGEIKQLLNF